MSDGVVYGCSLRGIGDGHLTTSVYASTLITAVDVNSSVVVTDGGGIAGCALRTFVSLLVVKARVDG